MNDGRFKKGEHRICTKVCDRCKQSFTANTGNRKRCPGCCKCLVCLKQLPNATDLFCGNSCSGKWKYHNSPNVKKGLEIGQHHPKRLKAVSEAAKRQAGKPRYNLRGPRNPNWNGGGVRKERHTAMGRVEYIAWRKSIYKRDDYTCQHCGSRGGKLNAHHKRKWKDHPELRYSLDNGETLCVICHREAHRKLRLNSQASLFGPTDRTS